MADEEEKEEMERDEGKDMGKAGGKKDRKKNKVCQTNLFSPDCLLNYFPSLVSAFFV